MVELWQDDSKLMLKYGENYEDMSFKQMLNKNPRAFTEKAQEFCPHCNNPKTLISTKKISKLFNKGYVQLVLAIIRKHNLKEFTLKDIRKILNEDITDGTLQNKALIILNLLGYVRKEIKEYTEENVTKIKYVYILNQNINIPSCYLVDLDKHDNDVKWVRKRLSIRNE